MKKIQRIPALLLAMLMLASLCLTSCQKSEEAIAADKVAEAFFNIILKDDASAAVELFGYASEEDARKDMGIGESLYAELADQIVDQFASEGVTASTEDAQALVDAFLTMFKNVNMTAKVKNSDEKAGTAVVTCTINTFDSDSLTNAMTRVVTDIMSDPSALEAEDDELYSMILKKMAEAIAGLTPSENTKDFDVDFELTTLRVNDKDVKAWLPVDSGKFGEAIGTNAIGG